MATKTIKRLPPIRRGDTKTWQFNLSDKDGVALDITGFIFTVTIKESLTDPNSRAIISKSVVAGPTNNDLDDPVNGLVFFTLLASETEKLSVQTYQIGISKSVPSTPENIITTFLVDELVVLPDATIN